MHKAKLSKFNYSDFSERMIKGFEYLNNTDWESIKDGKYEIDGENLYVNIQTYKTKSEADFEAHRKYVDIQYIISGKENIGVVDYLACTTTVPYDEAKDIEFLRGSGRYITLNKGEFLVLYPEDAHKPSISINPEKPTNVRKAVVKVKL